MEMGFSSLVMDLFIEGSLLITKDMEEEKLLKVMGLGMLEGM